MTNKRNVRNIDSPRIAGGPAAGYYINSDNSGGNEDFDNAIRNKVKYDHKSMLINTFNNNCNKNIILI